MSPQHVHVGRDSQYPWAWTGDSLLEGADNRPLDGTCHPARLERYRLTSFALESSSGARPLFEASRSSSPAHSGQRRTRSRENSDVGEILGESNWGYPSEGSELQLSFNDLFIQ